jgi:DNA-binding transcriptional LysR family regulator
MSLDLNLLRILLAVYETKNAGAAAHRLGMSQPGLSGALKRARASLGDPLFLRTARGMEPTARTRELIDPIRDVLATVDSKIISPARFVPAESTSEFRIALSDIGETVYLPTIVRCIAEHASNATIRSVSLKPRQLEEAMEQGKVDLAIGYFPDFKSDDIFEQTIGTSSFRCIGNIEHPLRGPRLTMGQFQSLGHAVVETEGRSQELFEQFLRMKKIRRKVTMRLSHFMSIPAIIAGTDLLVTVPGVLADLIVSQGNAKVYIPPFAMPTFTTKIHWHRTARADPRVEWLRKTVLVELRKLVRP